MIVFVKHEEDYTIALQNVILYGFWTLQIYVTAHKH